MGGPLFYMPRAGRHETKRELFLRKCSGLIAGACWELLGLTGWPA